MRPPSAEPTEESYLTPCPHCGSPNGLNASSCWDCETTLFSLEGRGVESSSGVPLNPVAGTADHADAVAGGPGERRSAAGGPDDPRATLDRAFAPLRQASEAAARRRRRWLAAGVVAAGVALVVLAYPILQSPVALRVEAAGREPGPPLAPPVAPRQVAVRVSADVAKPDAAVVLGFTGSESKHPGGEAPTAEPARPTATPDSGAAGSLDPTRGCASAVAALGLCDRDADPK